MRRHPLLTHPDAVLIGLAILLLGAVVMRLTTSTWWPPAPVQSSPPTPTPWPTPRPLHQTYAYLPGPLTVNGVPYARQTKPGGTLSVTWMARADAQSADVTPVTLSLLVYGPFTSSTDLDQAMHLGGVGATPVPVSQLAIDPFAVAPPVRTDTWTTIPFTTTLHLPASMPAGRYYDVVVLSVAGTQTLAPMARGDSPIQVMSASG